MECYDVEARSGTWNERLCILAISILHRILSSTARTRDQFQISDVKTVLDLGATDLTSSLSHAKKEVPREEATDAFFRSSYLAVKQTRN